MHHYYILGLTIASYPEECIAIFNDYEYTLLKDCKCEVLWSGNADSRHTAMSAWLEDNETWLKGLPKEEFLTIMLF